MDTDNLIYVLEENVKGDINDFGDLVNLDSALSRSIVIGAIEDGTGLEVDSVIRYWNRQDEKRNISIDKREPIKLFIDSFGGSLTDALTIIDSIKMSVTPVIGICVGAAYSAGFFILISCKKRYAYPHASFLFHEGSTSNGGTAAQFANFAAFYKKQLNQLKDIVIKNTKITEEEYHDIKKDDVWYDVEEALEKGIIDEVVREHYGI